LAEESGVLEENFPQCHFIYDKSHMAYSNTSMEQPIRKALLPACFMLVLFLGLFFKAEDGGDMFFKNVVDFQQTTWHYNPGNRGLHKRLSENLKPYIYLQSSWYS
jgi:hypothetical protein